MTFSGGEFAQVPVSELDRFRITFAPGNFARGIGEIQQMVARDELYFPAPEVLRIAGITPRNGDDASVTVVISRNFSRRFWDDRVGPLIDRVERL